MRPLLRNEIISTFAARFMPRYVSSALLTSSAITSAEDTSAWRRLLLLTFALLGALATRAQHTLHQSETSVLFESARILQQHAELGAAQQQFADFVRKAPPYDPRSVEAQYYQALYALNLHQQPGQRMADTLQALYPHSSYAPLIAYDAAYNAYERKEYEAAAERFQQVDFDALGKDRKVAGSFYWGYSLFNLKQLDSALQQFNVVKTVEGQFQPAACYYAGFVELYNDSLDMALVDLRRAEQNPSYAAQAPYMIAYLYYKQGKADDLLAYVDSLGDRKVANRGGIRLLTAEAQLARKNYPAALAGYREYISARGEGVADKAILLKAGLAAYYTGQQDDAVSYLQQSALSSDSIGAYSSYYLGALYLKKGLKPLALNAFSSASRYKADPDMAQESAYQEAKLLYDLDRYDEAVDALQTFAARYPFSARRGEVDGLLSQAYVSVANYDKAISYIESLPARTPTLNAAYQKATLLKGAELFNMERYAESGIFFDKSIQHPADQGLLAEACFWSGEACSAQGQYGEAVARYERALEAPAQANSELTLKIKYVLGYAFFNMGQYQKAQRPFQEFVNQAVNDPRRADGALRLADCRYVEKSYKAALEGYKEYISLGGKDKDYAMLQVGVILGIEQHYVAAKAFLDRLLATYPSSPFAAEAAFQRAQLEFEQGKYTDAVAEFSALIDRGGESKFIPYAYARRAAAHYNLKQYDETIADYAALLEKYPTHPVSKNALLPLREALEMKGRSAEFDNYLTHYKESNPASTEVALIEFETARQLYFNQKYEQAITSFKSYEIAYPQGDKLNEAQYYQAEAYYRLGDTLRAETAYRRALENFDTPFFNRSLLRLGELSFGQKAYARAIVDLGRLEPTGTSQRDRLQAWSGIMASYFALGRYDSSDVYAREILNERSENQVQESRASLFLGKSALERGNYEEAKDEFLIVINAARDECGAEAKYMLGKLFFLQQEYQRCYQTLVELNTDFAPYTLWVGRSFLLLSDSFAARGNLFQAESTLKSLIDRFPDQNIRTQAKEKLAELRLRRAAEQMPKDSLTRAADGDQ